MFVLADVIFPKFGEKMKIKIGKSGEKQFKWYEGWRRAGRRRRRRQPKQNFDGKKIAPIFSFSDTTGRFPDWRAAECYFSFFQSNQKKSFISHFLSIFVSPVRVFKHRLSLKALISMKKLSRVRIHK